jgi:endonuclease/exonuclease/phosphatase family metal-dependent hydrolase
VKGRTRGTTPLFRILAALAFAAGVAGLACNGGGDGDAPEATPSPLAPTEAATTRLVVIDLNVLHGIVDEDPDAEPFDRFAERLEVIAQALAAAQPDVVLLQEVVSNPGPDYPSVRDRLLDALGPGYTAVFGNFLGDPIDTEGLGQMTFTRLPVLSSENRSVGEIRSVHRVTVRTDEGPLDIYNAHLEGTGAVTEAGADASLEEIERVLAFINETQGGGPVILGGDFNAEPGDPSVQRLLEEGFIDAVADAGDATCAEAGDPGCTSGTTPLGEPGDRADRRIDYLFVLPGSQAAVEVVEAALFLNEPVDIGEGRVLWASDHIGVRAVVEVGNGS